MYLQRVRARVNGKHNTLIMWIRQFKKWTYNINVCEGGGEEGYTVDFLRTEWNGGTIKI